MYLKSPLNHNVSRVILKQPVHFHLSFQVFLSFRLELLSEVWALLKQDLKWAIVWQVIRDQEIVVGVTKIHLRTGSLKMGTDNTTRSPFSVDVDGRISLLSLLHNRRELLHELPMLQVRFTAIDVYRLFLSLS